MGKILGIILGTASIVIGIILCFVWSEALILGLKFSVMFILLFGGSVALIAGISELKDSIGSGAEEIPQQDKKE